MKFNYAIIVSIIAHLLLIAFLAVNFHFSKIEINASGMPQPQINAHAVNSARVDKLVERLREERQNKARQEKKRLDDLQAAEQQAKQRREDEERKAEDARKKREQAEIQRKAEEEKALSLKKKREKEEKERQQKAETERKLKAEQEKKRKAEEERKRKAKEEAERKRKAAAEEKARQEALEKEMQAQMDAEAAELAAAQQQQINSEVGKYNTLIEGKIRRNWFKPENPGSCTFRISIAPGGLVINIEVIGGDNAYCESGRRAILRAEPLPMSNDPDVYQVLKVRTFKLDNEKNEASN